MNYRLIIYIFIIIFSLCSCSNQKHKQAYILKNKSVFLGEDYIGYGGFLAFYQDNIVGVDFSPSMQPFFRLNLNGTSQPLFHFGNRGQGPNDFIMPYSIQHLYNQTIGVFDVMSRNFCELRIPKENEGLIIDKKIKIDARLSRVIKTVFNQYIGLSFDDGMFMLADSTGKLINTFFEYPYRDTNERLCAIRSFAYQGTLTVNPSKNKLVYSSYHGEIIHFYEIKNNSIHPITIIDNEYPLYKVMPNENDGVMNDLNGKLGYIATYATDQYVYAIFSRETLHEHGIKVNLEGKILRIFNWNGVLVKEYELDLSCGFLCVSDDDDKIWTVVSDPDITLALFELENTIEKKTVEDIQKNNKIENPLMNEGELYKSLPDFNAEIISDSLFLDYDTAKYVPKISIDTLADKTIRYNVEVMFKE